MNQRTFEIKDAVREAVGLNIGIGGPSGGGKTGSALELAHGVQEVVGGDIGCADTEAKRMLHYAGAPLFSDPKRRFKFRHMPFGAPFSPLDYMQAWTALIKAGCKTIVTDSMSHEHEGPGGVLEMHEKQLDKLAGDDWEKRNKMTFLAWAKPKAERRALINYFLQQQVNFIFCFRAKEKMKIIKGKPPVEMGWQPIAGEEFVYEMTLNCLLMPRANGVPEWNPEYPGEKQMVKLPEQFKGICTQGRPLSAAMGRELALWAKGGVAALPAASSAPASAAPAAADQAQVVELTGVAKACETKFRACKSLTELEKAYEEFNEVKGSLPMPERMRLIDIKNEIKAGLS